MEKVFNFFQILVDDVINNFQLVDVAFLRFAFSVNISQDFLQTIARSSNSATRKIAVDVEVRGRP